MAGIWYHDVPSGDTERLLGRDAAGKSGGFPAAGGHLVAWEYWAGKRGEGPAAIQTFNLEIAYRWRLTEAGRAPRVAGDVVFWVEPDGGGKGKDVIRGVNALTDAEYALETGGHVKSFSAWGPWAVWISGRTPPGMSGPAPSAARTATGWPPEERLWRWTVTASCGPPQRAGTPPRSSRGTAGPATPRCSAVCEARDSPSR